ncbi:MAG: glycoside hydrolase [Saprospirales bacterium]|nr:glycoside hydrolase [Saprospirales bacterium]
MGRIPHFFFAFLFFTGQIAPASAQIAVPGMGLHTVLNGYAKTIRGETLPYFSVYPDYARDALLTRCTDGQMAVAWETAPVPAGSEPYVYFSWIAAHSSGTSGGIRHFDLYVNDRLALTFTTHPKQYPPAWSFAGPDSTRLVFAFQKQDGAFDAHGIAYLRVPRSACAPGRPLQLKVVGQAQNSPDWYMTFQYAFEEKIDIEPLPFLLRGDTPRQPLQFTILHFGAPDSLHIRIGGGPAQHFTVQNGIQTLQIPVPAVSEKTQLPISARIGMQMTLDKAVELRPVIPREIDLVHHSHTDIGYSHYQEEVAAIHTANIRQALRMIEKTQDYPEGSRFVWNIESLWAVENFLREAGPAEIRQFVQAVRRGQIGLSALYANILTGLCSPEELRWWTEYADTLRARYDLPIRSAMFSDIPGLSWEVVPALAQRGVRYFSNGPNYIEALPDGGDRIGSTLRAQGDRPFWWKSASGRDSILFWTCGKGYSSWHGFAPGAVAERGPRKIAAYLNALEAAAYPYELVQWRYNIVSDNGPIDSAISDFVRTWNATYASPRLVLANVNDVFERFERQYGPTLPVWSGDYTPYWEDGAYSTAAEETENRMLSSRLAQLERLASQQQASLPSGWWYQAKRHVLLFHEHTWGAWCSVSQPDAPFTVRQWDYKKRLLDSARLELRRIEQALLPVPGRPAAIAVVNTLPWARSGVVEVEWPAAGTALADEQGRPVPVQALANGRRVFVATDVPANGRRVYRIAQAAGPVAGAFVPSLAYTPDTASGALAHLNARGREWVAPGPYGGLAAALYLAGRNPDSFRCAAARRSSWAENGPVLQRLRTQCALEGTLEVVYEVSQYRGLDLLHLSVVLDKKNVREKESLHLAFPFRMEQPVVRIGAGAGWIIPGQGQLPGSNQDFFAVQRWLDVSDAAGGVTLCSPQGALFEIGNLIDERPLHRGYKKWQDRSQSAPTVFLYAMNNYWHTNYKADQGGRVRFDVYLHLHDAFDAGQAARWGAEAVEPLVPVWRE